MSIFGNTVVKQYKCLSCGSLFFPEADEKLCSHCKGKKVSDKQIQQISPLQKIPPKFRRSPYPTKRIFKRDNYTCRYCGRSAKDDCLVKLTIDHFIPYKYSGNHHPDNLLTACWDCHKHKSDMIFETIEQAKEYIMRKRELNLLNHNKL